MRERNEASISSRESPASLRSSSRLTPYQSQPQSTVMNRKPPNTRLTATASTR